MTKGGITVLLGAIAMAAIAAVGNYVPDAVVDWHNSHMDKRYLLAEVYQQQLDVQNLRNFRIDRNALEEKERAAESESERRIYREQLRELDEERDDYKTLRGLK